MSLDETGKLKAQWLPRQPKYLNRSEREQYQAGRAAFLGQLPKVGETGDRAATMKSHVGLPRPRNTPAEIIDNLNKAINAGPHRPQNHGATLRPRQRGICWLPADFAKFISGEAEKWANVIKFAGIKVN